MPVSASLLETKTLPLQPNPIGTPDERRSLLMLFEENASSLIPLPDSGEVIIGRAQEAQIRLRDPATSRRHACLSISRHDIRLRDLESHNGTYVNGEAVTLPRALLSGDVISICSATLILHRQQEVLRPNAFAEIPLLRQRLDEETERASRYQRPLAVLVLDFGTQPPDKSAVAGALEPELRRIALSAWESPTRLLMVAPELSAYSLPQHAERLLHGAGQLGGEVRLGYAVCPTDGTDGDTLIVCARSAAQAASPRQFCAAATIQTVRKVGDEDLILAEPAMVRIYQLVERLAQSDLSVLIGGETGTGKELVARALHLWSRRQSRPLINVNCATLSESLAESQLFGHAKGSFTGAYAEQRGLLESARGGTVFFDEVGELSLSVQAKLLRALERKSVQPVGVSVERPIDVRVVAATNRDLEREVKAGRFREDLFYRFGVGTISLPPLRARKRELPILARAFLAAASARQGCEPLSLSNPVMERLLSLAWPGNVRQLKNEMEYLAATVLESVVDLCHLPERLDDPLNRRDAEPAEVSTAGKRPFKSSLQDEVRALEHRRIVEAMSEARGAVAVAAELLGMPQRTLYYKLKQHGLSP